MGRLSGDYALDKTVCNENYYQCANGISYMRKLVSSAENLLKKTHNQFEGVHTSKYTFQFSSDAITTPTVMLLEELKIKQLLPMLHQHMIRITTSSLPKNLKMGTMVRPY